MMPWIKLGDLKNKGNKEQLMEKKMLKETVVDDEPKKGKRKQTYLSDIEKWLIATYCIEHKCVMVDRDGKFTRLRMFLTSIMEEINTEKVIDHKITEHHIKTSLEFFNSVVELTKCLPKVPPQESLQEEILKIEVQRKTREADELAKKVETLEQLYANAVIRLENVATQLRDSFRNDAHKNIVRRADAKSSSQERK